MDPKHNKYARGNIYVLVLSQIKWIQNYDCVHLRIASVLVLSQIKWIQNK